MNHVGLKGAWSCANGPGGPKGSAVTQQEFYLNNRGWGKRHTAHLLWEGSGAPPSPAEPP